MKQDKALGNGCSEKNAFFSFDGLQRPVSFSGCEKMMANLKIILRDWKFQEVPVSAAVEPVMSVRENKLGYHRESPWLTKAATYRDPLDAACDFVVDLVNGYVADNLGMLCIHCAAVEFSKGLVIFPAAYRTGKSKLAVALAQAGARVFTDDALPVPQRHGKGMALGILPRLRQPVPNGVCNAFLAFTRERAIAGSEKFLYINLNRNELAPFGTTAKIIGVVIPDLTEGPAALVPASDGEAVKATASRNFTHEVAALDILERLHTIVKKAECYTLKYEMIGQAVDILMEKFGLYSVLPEGREVS